MKYQQLYSCLKPNFITINSINIQDIFCKKKKNSILCVTGIKKFVGYQKIFYSLYRHTPDSSINVFFIAFLLTEKSVDSQTFSR